MLLQMRNFTRSWVSYVLLFILAAMFVLFLGNGQSVLNAVNFTSGNYVARGEGFIIEAPQLNREIELALQRLRSQGQNISQQDAIRQGAHRQLLERLIGRMAFQAYADRLGVSASDLQVANQIRQIPTVQNPVTGAFDEESYQAFLAQLRYTQPEFERDIRGDLTAQMLMEALVIGTRVPTSYAQLVYAYQAETRVVSIAEAPAAAVGAIPPATAEQLQTLYREVQEQLRVPEYRVLTLVFARAQDFVPRVTVPEDRLAQELEARRASLTQPEKRTYVRISAQTEQQANDAAARLARGEDANAIATALHLQATRGENQARADVPDANVAEAVFSMQPRAAPRVIRGALTPWAVVRVDSITPAQEPNLAEAREQVRQAIALDEARQLLDTAITGFDDARAEGTAVAEAARRAGLTVLTTPPIDAEGRGQDGQPVAALAQLSEQVRAGFETDEGETTDFVPAGDADVVVAVDRIIPATVRPFDQVRAQLEQLYTGRERARRLRELGERVVTAVHNGQTFAAAARANHFTVVVPSRPIDRRQAAQIPARGLPGQIFAAQQDDVLSDVRSDGGAVLVAVVERINRPDLTAAAHDIEAIRAQMAESVNESVGQAIQEQITANAHPRRNDRMLQQLYPTEDESGQAAQ